MPDRACNETMFVSSEFDIFARKPVQESILETLGVFYKPIASVDQSDLEFLIPADSETYIDLDIKVYVHGKHQNRWDRLGRKGFHIG